MFQTGNLELELLTFTLPSSWIIDVYQKTTPTIGFLVCLYFFLPLLFIYLFLSKMGILDWFPYGVGI